MVGGCLQFVVTVCLSFANTTEQHCAVSEAVVQFFLQIKTVLLAAVTQVEPVTAED